MEAKRGATLIFLCPKLNRRDRGSGMISNLPGLCPTVQSCKHFRRILHGIQITKINVIHNTNEVATRHRISNELPIALLRGKIELLSDAVDLKWSAY